MTMSNRLGHSGLNNKKELPEVKVAIKCGTASLQQRAAWLKFWQKLISEVNSNEQLNPEYHDSKHKYNKEKYSSSIERAEQ